MLKYEATLNKDYYYYHSFSKVAWYISVPTGIEGAFSGAGGKTVIPRKVIGKFSIRLVPDMLPDEVCRLVTDHIEKVHKKSGSPNPVK